MNFLRKLRETANACTNDEFQYALREGADAVDSAISDLWKDATEDNLRRVNSMWAYSYKVLMQTPPEGSPAPLSGSPEPARLAA